MQSISTLPKLSGARVIVRVDYNVPLKKNKIQDTRRITASYKSIDAILKKGGTPVLVAHFGDGKESLRPVATFLSKTYHIVFITNDIFDARTKEIFAMVPKGTVILLENIRRYEGEEKNDTALAKKIASFGQYYVNDAFSVSHRAHASVVGVPKYLPSYAGFTLLAEIAALTPVLENNKHPFVFILGGAKFATKIPLLKRFAQTADQLVIAGAILNNFYKVAGFEVGKSVVEDGYDAPIKTLSKNPQLLLPVDVIVERTGTKMTVTPNEIEKNDIIVDIGPQSVKLIASKIAAAKLVVWNGPTGWYEKGYTAGTKGVAKAIAISKARSIIGGGDTGAVIEKLLKEAPKNIFISTGGGAALDFLAKGTLLGIKALK